MAAVDLCRKSQGRLSRGFILAELVKKLGVASLGREREAR